MTDIERQDRTILLTCPSQSQISSESRHIAGIDPSHHSRIGLWRLSSIARQDRLLWRVDRRGEVAGRLWRSRIVSLHLLLRQCDREENRLRLVDLQDLVAYHGYLSVDRISFRRRSVPLSESRRTY